MPPLGAVAAEPVASHSRMSGYLATLDGLRGIAAIGVVVHHTGNALHLAHGFHRGYLFVPFFFTLSGFVVAKSYEPRLGTSLSLKDFTVIRLIRLVPMIWLSAVLDMILGQSIGSALLAFFVIPSFFGNGAMFPANAAEWSLFFELVGNFFHALAFKILGIGVLVVVLAVSLGCLTLAVSTAHSVNIGWHTNTFWGGASLFTACYVIGILIHRWTPLLRGIKVLRLPYVVILAVFIFPFLAHGALGTITFGVLDMLCAVVLFPLVIVAASVAEIGPLADRCCRWLGAISYPLYIIHLPLVDFLSKHASDAQLGLGATYAAGVAIILIAIAAGWIALRYYDAPFRAMLTKLARRRRAGGIDTATGGLRSDSRSA